MVLATETQIKAIGQVLKDPQRPLKERFRALFTLKNIGGPTSIECIKEAFTDTSALLKHELAYCLGQMRDERAIEVLTGVLEDLKQLPIVRHEAAEALGAIGSENAVDVLKKYLNDSAVEVAQTCDLALKRIEWLKTSTRDKLEKPSELGKPSGDPSESENPFKSVDPAPPLQTNCIDELKRILLDEEASLFERYRAMFALRNVGSEEAVLALCSGLRKGGALFRHEIAFVLGQLQKEASVPFLKESLVDKEESEMVRHECAEALGAIATEECMEILNEYLKDEKRVVKESCEIALDMCEYENSPEFQYANALQS